MRRLTGITTLYAVVAALAVAAPLSATEEPAQPATGQPTAPDAGAQPPAPAAPPPPAPPAPAPSPAAPAPTPAAPAPTPAAQPEPQPLRDDALVREPRAVAAASQTVTIQDFEFGPSGVTVDVGDTVTWTNSDSTRHSATAGDGSFDTGLLAKGETGSKTFDEAGTFRYICKPHPFMKGTVTVRAASGGGGDDGDGDGGGEDTGTSGDSGSTAGGSEGDSTATGSGSGSAGGSGADSGSPLPATGFDAAGLAVIGLMTLALGAYLRRRTGAEAPRQ